VKITKVSPPQTKANKDEKSERQSNYTKKEEIGRTVPKQQQQQRPSKQSEKESSYEDMEINAILELESLSL
jgi:kinesin family member 2/24